MSKSLLSSQSVRDRENLRSIFFRVTFATLAVVFAVGMSTSQAQSEKLFSDFNPDSRVSIDYGPMDDLLFLSVWQTGRSTREYSRAPRPKLGSRMNYHNTEPTRLEGNRVFYHTLEEEHIAWVSDYRRNIEAIPDQISISRLSRNEQLAYWLNLYTVTVYEEIAKRYPVTNLRSLRQGSDSFFNQKVLNVEGVALSLRDIETRVLTNWSDPVVIYGLFQGSVGGPNIRTVAYRGADVFDQLADNARDYVNSLRGVQFRGDVAKVSEFYGWQAAFFPNFEYDVRQHMLDYADGSVTLEFAAATRVEASVYDWHIADLYNGRMAGGASADNPAEFIMGQMYQSSAGEGGAGVVPSGFSASGNLADASTAAAGRYPAHVQDFMVGVYRRFLENNRSSVTIENVESEDETIIDPEQEEDEGGAR